MIRIGSSGVLLDAIGASLRRLGTDYGSTARKRARCCRSRRDAAELAFLEEPYRPLPILGHV